MQHDWLSQLRDLKSEEERIRSLILLRAEQRLWYAQWGQLVSVTTFALEALPSISPGSFPMNIHFR